VSLVEENYAMSAAEIIAELPRLSPSERNAVERQLAQLKRKPALEPTDADRKQWTRELDDLAETARRLATGKEGSSIAEIINDIRDGR
jgi:hypothetical protein